MNCSSWYVKSKCLKILINEMLQQIFTCEAAIDCVTGCLTTVEAELSDSDDNRRARILSLEQI